MTKPVLNLGRTLMMPKVSVVVSVFDNVRDFKFTLETILQQTYKNYEVIVVDDGNPYPQKSVLREICLCDSRITLIENEKNKGLTLCLIQGVAVANGEYIARIDNGDLMVPKHRLETQAHELINNGYGIVGGEIEIIDVLNRSRFHSHISKKQSGLVDSLISGDLFYHVCVMFSKSVYLKSGGYNKNLKTGQDNDLWPRILQNSKGKNIPLVFAIAPMKHGSISVSKNNEQIMRRVERIKTNKKNLGKIAFLWSLSQEYLKLILPIRVRVFARYFKNMKFVGFIGRNDCKDLSSISAWYFR